MTRVLTQLELGPDRFDLIELGRGGDVGDPLRPDQAMSVLRHVATPDVSNRLRTALSVAGLHPVMAVGDGAVLARVGELLQSHKLALRLTRQPRPSITHESLFRNLSDLSELAPGSSAEEAPQELTYLEFRLVDDAGQPIADQPFRLDLPNGSTVEQKTDANGYFIARKLDTPGEGTLDLQPQAS